MNIDDIYHPVVFVLLALLTLGLCTYVPIKVKNDRMRQWLYWCVLIPASLVLMFYVYPAGIEFFRRLALL